MSQYRIRERGDTVVELIFAFALFSLVLVGTLVIMNTGIRMSQLSLETTLVRQQMDAQAEMVRYILDTDNSAWDTIKSKLASDIMPLSSSTNECPTLTELGTPARASFFVSQTSPNVFAVNNVSSANYANSSNYARIDYGADRSMGIWLQIAEAENVSSSVSPGSSITAYDLYVHACWARPGSDIPATTGTIVRLYDRQ